MLDFLGRELGDIGLRDTLLHFIIPVHADAVCDKVGQHQCVSAQGLVPLQEVLPVGQGRNFGRRRGDVGKHGRALGLDGLQDLVKGVHGRVDGLEIQIAEGAELGVGLEQGPGRALDNEAPAGRPFRGLAQLRVGNLIVIETHGQVLGRVRLDSLGDAVLLDRGNHDLPGQDPARRDREGDVLRIHDPVFPELVLQLLPVQVHVLNHAIGHGPLGRQKCEALADMDVPSLLPGGADLGQAVAHENVQ